MIGLSQENDEYMNITNEHSCDVLVIGSGAAGLSLALRVAPHGKVIVLSKGPRNEGSTYYAQGGIAAVFDESDTVESHVEDTLVQVHTYVTEMSLHLLQKTQNIAFNG